MLNPPTRAYLFFLFHWLFHCEVNNLLSAICQKKQKKHKYHKNQKQTKNKKTKKAKTKTKNTKNRCIGEPSPFPHPKVGLPFFLSFFFSLLFFCFSVFFRISFFLGTPPLPKPNSKQVIQNVYMFILSGVGERWWAKEFKYIIYTLGIQPPNKQWWLVELRLFVLGGCHSRTPAHA